MTAPKAYTIDAIPLLDATQASFRSFRDSTTTPYGCWPWTGTIGHHGYGYFNVPGPRHLFHDKRFPIVIKAPRMAFLLEHGYVPPLFICHHCDNPCCVRPLHLFADTPAGNMKDAMAKNRIPKGATHIYTRAALQGKRFHTAKLLPADIQEMCRLRATTALPIPTIGALFGVAPSTVYRILSGKGWPSIERLGPLHSTPWDEETKEIARRLFFEEKLPVRTIARSLDLSPGAVYGFIARQQWIR